MEEEGLGFLHACDRVAAHTVFTTHTPVPAGHDRFAPELVEEHLGPLRDRLGIVPAGLLALGRVQPGDPDETFCMTVLALKLARRVNGVSALHGDVSRQMWRKLWPDREEHQVPIGHITNGVHTGTWMAPAMRALMDTHLGDGWMDRQHLAATWAPVDDIPDEELWGVRRSLRRDLIAFVRDRAAAQAQARGEEASVVDALREALSEDALLVGFARRFATYKRATLLLEDLDALDRLVNDPDRPMNLVFAGKAHPRDDGGKQLIQRLHRVSRDKRFAGRLVLLSGYDMGVGRQLTAGVDLWLNNPRRPLEASGTSGQKVVLNGGLNCSVLDGWWAEAWDGSNGFAIGEGLTHRDAEVQDRRDSEGLKVALAEAVALFHQRDEAGLPAAWLGQSRRSLRTLGWRFNAPAHGGRLRERGLSARGRARPCAVRGTLTPRAA